jgi:hypothetical protein
LPEVTIFSGAEAVRVGSTGAALAALLGLGSLLGAASETVAVTVSETVAVTVEVEVGVSSTELAVEEVLDVLTILLSDYTHISSVFLSSFQYILYIGYFIFIFI